MKRSSFLKKGALFAFLGILTCSLYLHKKFSEKALLQTSYSANDSFIPIPIKKYSKANIPSIEVQVEGISVMAELDLGLKGELSFSPAFVELLKEKRYLGANTFYGIRGIPHSKRIFEIPCATIGSLHFSNAILQEEADGTQHETSFLQNPTSVPSFEVGTVGWMLFNKKNLLLDFEQSCIAVCSGANSLKANGYSVEKFTKVPLLTDRGLLEFIAELPTGTVRCMIDTGATINILNKELKPGETLVKAIWDSKNRLKLNPLQIGGTSFGEISFAQVPISIPIQIEAILGMEFFSSHLVYLDFKEGFIYLK